MPTSIVKKLRIQPGSVLLTLNAPAGFQQNLGALPEKVRLIRSGKQMDQVHWFVRNRAQLEKELPNVLSLLQPGVLVWVYYPKGSSKLQTDLTRDKGWDRLLAEEEQLAWINLVSFDETWSVFGFRSKTEADKKRAAKEKPAREIFNWVNPETKAIRLPEDLAALFKKHKPEAAYFNSLSFTNKKEYIEWIVTAKREETRRDRIQGTLERLKKQWKNPRNM